MKLASMYSMTGLIFLSLVIRSSLGTAEFKHDEMLYADRAIAWTHSGQAPVPLRRLALSIVKAGYASRGQGVAFVLVYENINVCCLKDGRIRWPWPQAMDQGLNLITSTIKCANPDESFFNETSLSAKRKKGQDCHTSSIPKMLSNTLYLLPMDQTRVDETPLLKISEAIVRHGHSRKDLVDNGRGNNFRFVLDKLMIPLGVKKLIYLDSDAVMEASPTPLYEENDDMPLSVASSHHNFYAQQTARNEFHEMNMKRTLKWGFSNPEKQCFNAGVMMINVAQYCLAGITSKMVEVSESHIKSPLFRQSGNQPIIEVAAARHTYYVPYIWNCRHEKDPNLECKIIHSKRDLNVSKTLSRMMVGTSNNLDSLSRDYRLDNADEGSTEKDKLKRGIWSKTRKVKLVKRTCDDL